MNGWQELISNIVTAALWPLVVLILGILFRDTLRSVVARVTKLEAFGANIEISESVRQLDAAADEVQIEAAGKSGGPGGDGESERNDLPLRHLIEVVKISPSAAVVDAWREVEMATLEYWELAKRIRGLPDLKRRTILEIIQQLAADGLISRYHASLLMGLRRTRNAVAHGLDELPEGQSLSYVDSAAIALQALQVDKWALETGGQDESSA